MFTREWWEEYSAKVAGKKDGQLGHPAENWEGGPVAYIFQLQQKYLQKIYDLRGQASTSTAKSMGMDEESSSQLKILNREIDRKEKEHETFGEKVSVLEAEKIGRPDENVGGRFAKHREISTPVYVIALILLIIGEFLVTIPAARLALGDSNVSIFWFEIDPIVPVALSIAVLSVVAAHLFGITLKSRSYRPRPQPLGALYGFIAFAVILVVTVLFLSAIRSENVSSENTLLLGDSAFGTILFFVLQVSFIAAATGLAFYHHSEIDSQIKAIKKTMKKLEHEIRNLYKRKSKVSSQLVTDKRLAIQMTNLHQKILRLESRYKFLANIYVSENVMNQPKIRTAPGKGLEVPDIPEEMLAPIWNIKVEDIRDVIVTPDEFHAEVKPSKPETKVEEVDDSQDIQNTEDDSVDGMNQDESSNSGTYSDDSYRPEEGESDEQKPL